MRLVFGVGIGGWNFNLGRRVDEWVKGNRKSGWAILVPA